MNNENSIKDALSNIVFYNGHEIFLMALANEMYYRYSIGCSNSINYHDVTETYNVDYEEHMLWMIFVSMFGDWGTSVNYGWIEPQNYKDCADFICDILDDYVTAEMEGFNRRKINTFRSTYPFIYSKLENRYPWIFQKDNKNE